MILSNVDIHDALDKGWLKITPEPTPRKLGDSAGKCPFQTSAVDLRLGSEIAYFREGIPAQIDLRKGDFNALFGPMSETRNLTDDQPYVLRPNKLVLGKTLEKIELPLLPSGVLAAASKEKVPRGPRRRKKLICPLRPAGPFHCADGSRRILRHYHARAD